MRTLSIKPNTSINRIKRKLGSNARERKRESEKRRRRLERVARWVSGTDVVVYFQKEGAKCQKAPMNANHDLEIYLPTKEHEQPATDLDPTVWDFVFQKAELVHELGHVLYTDFQAMEDYCERIDELTAKRLFKNLFNIVEDGAIEQQLASDYNVGNDLRIKNENLMISEEPGVEGTTSIGSRTQWLRFSDAVGTILLDWAKHNTGRTESLLDPDDSSYQFEARETREKVVGILPTLRDMVSDVLQEPKGAERVRIAYEYFEELRDLFEDEMDLEGASLEQLLGADPDDANVYVVRPGDGEPDDAEALEPDEDDIVIVLDPQQRQQEGEDDDDDGPEVRYGQMVAGDDEEQDDAEEAINWKQSVDSTGVKLKYVTEGDINSDTWTKAKKYGRRYKKAFQRALQEERASQRKPNQRAGNPDLQALWKLGYGESRVFEREDKPDEKDYRVVLVLDRSSSMNGHGSSHLVDQAEAVTTGMAWALEELGVEVCVLSVAGDVYMELPFAASVESRNEILCRGHADNSTPLGASLRLARDQLAGMDGEKILFAVTDGEPTDESIYMDELQKTTWPVVGAYFDARAPNTDDVRGYYHRITSCTKDELPARVEQMVKSMVV